MKILVILIALVLIGCGEANPAQEVNCDYKGGIILDRHDFGEFGGVFIKIKFEGEVIDKIQLFDIDKEYQVGDTINKPCII